MSGEKSTTAGVGKARRRVYSDEFKMEVVAYALDKGYAAAEKKFHVKSASIGYWRDLIQPRSREQKRKVRSYTEQQRNDAMELARSVGVAAAAAQLGIPGPTVNNWLLGKGGSPRQERYSSEFKASAIQRAAELDSVTAAAIELGIPKDTLGHWVRAAHPFERMRKRTYSREQKEQAIGRAREVGVAQASAEQGVVEDTLRKWIQKGGERRHATHSKYSAELKKRAIAFAHECGPQVAAKELNVHVHTLWAWLREGKEPRRRGMASTFDIELTWLLGELPGLMEWHPLATAWMREQKRSVGQKLGALTKFFRTYVSMHELAQKPSEFLHRETRLPDFYDTCCPKTSHGRTVANYVHDFINWVLKEHYSEPDDHGRLYVGQLFHNPVSFSSYSGSVHRKQTVHSPLPFGYIDELQQMLAVGENFCDWSWAHNALRGKDRNLATDWFEVSEEQIDPADPDCVFRRRHRQRQSGGVVLEMWSPVRWVALLVKLILPLRTFQVRVLDSGEADTWRYEPLGKDGLDDWALNQGPLRGGTEKNPVQQGVFRKGDGGTSNEVCLYVNTNKTADALKSGSDKGYTFPWVLGAPRYSDPFYWLSKLRRWQEKYNPLSRRTSWSELDGRHIDVKSDIQLAGFPPTCFLFRLSESGNPSERHLPISSGGLDAAWHKLLSAFEERLASRGEKNPNSSRIRLVYSGHGRRTFFPLHSLRVSILTALALDGEVPFTILQKVAGHSRLVMTLYYIRIGEVRIREALQAGLRRMHEGKEYSISTFLQSELFEVLLDKAICNSPSALAMVIPAHRESRNPAGWMAMHIGLCLVGGNTTPFEGNSSVGGCYNGGPNCGTPSKPKFAPVPGGTRNCVQCRWLVTAPHFLGALVAEFNNTAYHEGEQSIRCLSLSRQIDLLKLRRLEAEDAGLPFAEHGELSVALRQLEKGTHHLGELCSKMAACLKLIDRCVAAMNYYNESNASQQLLAVGSREEIGHVLNDVQSELMQVSVVCDDAETYPDLDPGKAVFRYGQLLDAALSREGRAPFFLTLPEDEQLMAANAAMRALARACNPDDPGTGRRTVVSLLDAKKSLRRSLGIDMQALLPSLGRKPPLTPA